MRTFPLLPDLMDTGHKKVQMEHKPKPAFSEVNLFQFNGTCCLVSVFRIATLLFGLESGVIGVRTAYSSCWVEPPRSLAQEIDTPILSRIANWNMLWQRKTLPLSQNGHWQHAECSFGGHLGSAHGGSTLQPSPVLSAPTEAGKAVAGAGLGRERAKLGREEGGMWAGRLQKGADGVVMAHTGSYPLF